jgi:hypothetical protein
MKVTRQDLSRCEMLVKTLNRAKIEVEGALEAMALSQVVVWVSELQKKILAEVTEEDKKLSEDTLQALQEFNARKEEKAKEESERVHYALELLKVKEGKNSVVSEEKPLTKKKK